MLRTLKIRLYPTKEQEEIMKKHIGGCRFIWNYMLAREIERYNSGEKVVISAYEMMRVLANLKKEEQYSWLYEISNASCQTICRDLEKAYKRFFNRQNNFPKFKSLKKSKKSFPVRAERLWFEAKYAHIERLGKVRYKTDYNLPKGRDYKFGESRITYFEGKWILTVVIERENQAINLTDKKMGIDLGVKKLAVVAFGEEAFYFDNINKSKKIRDLNKKIKFISRKISRKYRMNKQGNVYIKTKNIEKEEKKLRKLHRRIKNIRENYIHQITRKLVNMLPYEVIMEDLNVKGLLKNKKLSRAISEQCFYKFAYQMEYKCEEMGINFTYVDRFFPSSKTCSNCGCIKTNLRLSDREYYCEHCGMKKDRDYNAAINLMRYEA